jgi:hypothetical protein
MMHPIALRHKARRAIALAMVVFPPVASLGHAPLTFVPGVPPGTVSTIKERDARPSSQRGSSVSFNVNGIARISKSDLWAVGSSFDIATENSRAIALHWNGSRWVSVPTPRLAKGRSEGEFTATGGDAANDVWAVGDQQNNSLTQFPLIEHWNGARWSIVRAGVRVSNGGMVTLEAVSSLSRRDAWAVGNVVPPGASPERALIVHWNGRRWQKVALPRLGRRGGDLSGVAALSPHDVWAVGTRPCCGPVVNQFGVLIEHWNGRRWRVVPGPNGRDEAMLDAVVGLGRRNVYAVGNVLHGGGQSPSSSALIEHWNGRRWRTQRHPRANPGYELLTVATDRAHHLWTAGDWKGPGRSFCGGPVLRRGHGHWMWAVAPNPNASVVMSVATISPHDVWAVTSTHCGSGVALEHWNGRRWASA